MDTPEQVAQLFALDAQL